MSDEQDDCRTAPRPDGPARTRACLPGHGAEQRLSFWRLQGPSAPRVPRARLFRATWKGGWMQPEAGNRWYPGTSRKQP